MAKLSKPICCKWTVRSSFFDLKTTGLSIASDRVIEISFLKVYPQLLETHRWTERLNTGILIHPSARAVYGISDEDVADKPTFKRWPAGSVHPWATATWQAFHCLQDALAAANKWLKSSPICNFRM